MTAASLFFVSFEIGVPSLDEGHADLLAFIDELTDFTRGSLGSSQLAVWQRGFVDLIAAHFEDEEAWMDAAGLPLSHRQEHSEEHRRLLLQARALDAMFPAGGSGTVRDLHRLLRFEFFKHFVQCDAKLKDFIDKDGRGRAAGDADRVALTD